ncbi:hypothetical protein JCM8547_007582 [Rhodosporidiobolus lusitaniae]
MAWRCSGASQAELISNLARADLLSTPRVIEAFKQVDRAYYVQDKSAAYQDSPSYIGYGATISAPHMHAHAIENLEPFLKPGANVLDVGCGSGFLLPIFRSLVSPSTSSSSPSPPNLILGIDHLPTLVSLARSNLQADPAAAPYRMQEGESAFKPGSGTRNVQVICADGRKGSPEEYTPEEGWQVIHVGAAAPTLPRALVSQLASPGRMFIPVGTTGQVILQVDKDEKGRVTQRELFGVNYVPLTDGEMQWREGESP